MNTTTGIVLTGLALFFAGCNSEPAHDEARDKAVNGRANVERTQTAVDNARAPHDKVVNRAAEKAQGAITSAQYTADNAAAEAHAAMADAARSAADADRLKNDAARSGQDTIDNAQRDLNAFKNALR